ncbi:hypothetical protein C2G38_2104379 [Gigaspora rosea]|uniref:TLDc domain-containing protein n=1 Tax=Gigaspora rosea TaxID=44941 RepID=A0A397UQT0_9GLOM|nr:hypothetical protein C2G38_2104379 [Gigaspora rosea]
MKVEDTDEILGGYNPKEWDQSTGNYLVNCNDRFIFSLKNGNINSSTLSRVKVPQSAIFCNLNFGPCFGPGDLIMYYDFGQVNGCSHAQTSYEKAIRDTEGNFSITEYEVFQIKRK